MNPFEILFMFIAWSVLFVYFYFNVRKQSKALLPLPEDLSAEVRLAYLLDNYNRLESFCPEDFLTRDSASDLRNNLWSAFYISFRLILIQFCLYSMIIQNGVLIGGWPLHQIVWAALLVDSTVSIARSIFRSFKSYAQRLELGVDPLVTTTSIGGKRLIGVIGALGVIFTLRMIPQNNIDQLFVAISAVEFAVFYYSGMSFKISVTDEGIFHRQEYYSWQNVAWYRWYDHRQGVLVGIEPNRFRSAFLMILPATSETRDELDEMLERYLPDKRLDKIVTGTQKTFESTPVSVASV